MEARAFRPVAGITRCKLVDFADCKVFKLLTSQADRQGMSTHQFYQ